MHESDPLEMFDRRTVVTPVQAVQALRLEHVDPVYSLECSVEFGTLVGRSGDVIGEAMPSAVCLKTNGLRFRIPVDSRDGDVAAARGAPHELHVE